MPLGAGPPCDNLDRMRPTEHTSVSLKIDGAYLAVLLLLTAALFLPQLITGQTAVDDPDKMDVTIQWAPGRYPIAEAYRDGYFPLWTEDLFMGMPWVAYTHGSTMDPVPTSFFVFLDYFDAATMAMTLHFLIMAAGCFFMLRLFRVSSRSAFLGALVWTHSGMCFYLVNQFSNPFSAAWFPWMIASLIALYDRRCIGRFLALAITLSLAVLGGDVEAVVYALMLLGSLAVFYLPARGGGNIARTSALAVLALGLCFLVVQAQAVPVLELTRLSIRSPESAVQVSFSAQVKGWHAFMPQLLAPFAYYGKIRSMADFNSGLTPFYMGIIPILLAAYSLKRIRADREVKALAVTGAALLGYLFLMSLGPLEPVTSRLPLLSKLASRARMMQEVQLVIVVLFALELDKIDFTKLGARLAWGLIGVGIFTALAAPFCVAIPARAALAAAACLSGVAILFGAKKGLAIKHGANLIALCVILDVTLLALFCVPRNDKEDFRLEEGAAKYLNKNAREGDRFLAFNKLLGDGPNLPDLTGGALMETSIESPVGFMRLPMHRSFEFLALSNPGILKSDAEIFLGQAGEDRTMDIFAMTNPDLIEPRYLRLMNLIGVRYYIVRDLALKFSDRVPLLCPNGVPGSDWTGGGRYRIEMRGAGSSRRLVTSLPYKMDFQSYVFPGGELTFTVRPKNPTRASLDLSIHNADEGPSWKMEKSYALTGSELNVSIPLGDTGRLVSFELSFMGDGEIEISDATIARPNMPLKLMETGGVDIYVNDDSMPRAYVAHKVRVARNEAARAFITDPASDLRGTILLEKEDETIKLVRKLGKDSPPARRIEKVEYKKGHDRVELHARLLSPGYLFLSDAYAPGWRARANGLETKILRADLAFRSLFLPEGDHRIVMTYEPYSFRIGLMATLASVLFLVLAGGYAAARNRGLISRVS